MLTMMMMMTMMMTISNKWDLQDNMGGGKPAPLLLFLSSICKHNMHDDDDDDDDDDDYDKDDDDNDADDDYYDAWHLAGLSLLWTPPVPQDAEQAPQDSHSPW